MAMFNQKKDGYEGTTVIAEGVKVQGEFRGEGPMVIDGIVHGTITTKKNIDIGQTAKIDADIKAGSIVVAGKIKGNIVALERIEIAAGGRIDGDVMTSRLIIADGAILNGRCTMSQEKEVKEEAEEIIKESSKSKVTSRERVA